MQKSNRYIPVLITVALLALIGLQIVWLFMVYKQKTQELKDRSQEAILETSKRIQEEEDENLIVQNMDSLLVTDNIIGSDSGEDMRVIVSSIKNRLKIDTLKSIHLKQEVSVINDSSESTTIVNLSNGKMKKIVISSSDPDYSKHVIAYQQAGEEYQKHAKEFQRLAKEAKKETSKEKFIEFQKKAVEEENMAKQFEEQAKEHELLAKQIQQESRSLEAEGKKLEKASKELEFENKVMQRQKLKRKVKDLQTVFLKMAINAGTAEKNIDSMFNYNRVKTNLKTELLKQGIDIEPAFGLYFFPNRHPAKIKPHVVCNSPGFGKKLPAFINMPFYSDQMYDGQLIMKINYASPTNFIIKQMAGLLSLSLFITLLIGFVMIYLFRRMLSQEKLHRMKNDFINNMAHELKTPIATISLAVDGINNPAIKNDETKFKNYTSILKEENKKLNAHIERVLQTALLEKGELKLEKKEISLNVLLQNCLDAYRLQIEGKNAKVELSVRENITIIGDDFHLSNAFSNLLDNALKYSGENCEIHISLTKNGNMAEIRFKDNGIGIRKDLQAKVFDKFYRVQGGNIHDVKGSGLGLSYVRSIIEAHGGTIELKSEEEKGSEFIIKLRTNAG